MRLNAYGACFLGLTLVILGKQVIAVKTAQYNPLGGQRLFKIKRFVRDSSLTYTFDFQSRTTSLFEYYRLKYGYEIR